MTLNEIYRRSYCRTFVKLAVMLSPSAPPALQQQTNDQYYLNEDDLLDLEYVQRGLDQAQKNLADNPGGSSGDKNPYLADLKYWEDMYDNMMKTVASRVAARDPMSYQDAAAVMRGNPSGRFMQIPAGAPGEKPEEVVDRITTALSSRAENGKNEAYTLTDEMRQRRQQGEDVMAWYQSPEGQREIQQLREQRAAREANPSAQPPASPGPSQAPASPGPAGQSRYFGLSEDHSKQLVDKVVSDMSKGTYSSVPGQKTVSVGGKGFNFKIPDFMAKNLGSPKPVRGQFTQVQPFADTNGTYVPKEQLNLQGA